MLVTMIVKWTLQLLLLVVILGNIQETNALQCDVRDEVAAGRPCERACRSDGTCRNQNRRCECDGRCGASCLKKKCPSIPPILNGSSSVYPPSRTIDAVATYTCNHGYSLVGNATRTCLSHKQWSGNPPVCEHSREVHCDILNSPANGQVTYDSETRIVGTVATYQCNVGYTNVAGDQERTCEQNGLWSGLPVSCSQEPCSEDDIGVGQWRVEYNRVSVERGTRPHGTTATFVCTERGHRTNDTKQCLTGQWRGDAPTCTKIPCVRQNIRNGRVHYSTDNPEQGTARNVSCNVGYRATEMEDSVCDVGSWTTALPECFEKPCSEDDIGVGQWRVEYNRVSVERGTRPHGTTATFVCTERGHRTNDTKQCLTGQWRGDAPTCTKSPCPALVNHPDNLAVTYSEESDGSHYPHSTLATFHCVEEGFVLENVNEVQRICRRGEWRGPNTYPRCTIDISQLHMDISPTTSLTINPSGQFVLVTPIDEVTISCRSQLNSAQLSGDTRIRKDGEDTQGELSDDTSVFRLVIISPTAEDSGIYTCLSSGLSHSINVTFEEDNRCSRPDFSANIIAHVGDGEDTTAIGNRKSFMGGETITFRCKDVRYQLLDGPIHRQCIDGEWTEHAPRCETSRLKVGVGNTIFRAVSPDGTFIVYPIEGTVNINCQSQTGGRIGNNATITTNSTTQPSRRAYSTGKLKRLRLRNPTSGNDGTYTCEAGSQRHSIRVKFQDIRCPAPENFSNGRWESATANTLNPNAYILNEKVTLQCNHGFHESSNQKSRCNYQGQWSPPLSPCIAD